MNTRGSSIADLRAIAQPATVLGRESGEHWAGRLYMRKASIYLTRFLLPSRVTPDGLTWTMLGAGVAAALVTTIPSAWAAAGALALIQLQLLLDCSDGELARLRGVTGATGVYIDRLAHVVTDSGLAIAVGVRADGGLGSIGGWSVVGLAAGWLVCLVKAETQLVHVARAEAGMPLLTDEEAQPRSTRSRSVRRAVRRFPFHRALLALEMTVLSLAAALADGATSTHQGSRVLAVVLAAVGVLTVTGHLVSIMVSRRLR